MKSSKEVTPNDETLRYYFYFVQERMNMFWRRWKVNSFIRKTLYLGCTSLQMCIELQTGSVNISSKM